MRIIKAKNYSIKQTPEGYYILELKDTFYPENSKLIITMSCNADILKSDPIHVFTILSLYFEIEGYHSKEKITNIYVFK